MAKKVVTVEPSAPTTKVKKTPSTRVKKTKNSTPLTPKKVLKNITSEDGNININLIPKEQIEYYHGITKSLNNTSDLSAVHEYGSDLQKAMSKYSSTYLQTSFDNSNNNEAAKLISSLLTELEQVDINDLNQNKFKMVLRRIPILKKLVKSVDEIKNKYNNIEKNIEGVIQKLEACKQIAVRDNNMLKKQFEANVDYTEQLSELILAGKIKSTELEENIQEMVASGDYEDYQIVEAKDFQTSLNKRITDLELLKAVFEQSLTQIKLIIATNTVDIDNTNTQIGMTVPLWRNQLGIAMALLNQKNSIEVKNKVTETTNGILTSNSEMLKTQAIEVAKANESTVIDIETLKTTTNNLIETINGVRKIQEEGAAKRLAAEQEIIKLERDLEQASLGLVDSTRRVISRELLNDEGHRRLLEQ